RHTPLPLLPSPPPLFRALLLSNPAPSSHLSPLSLHDALPICDAPAWRARPVIDEHPVGEEAAQRGLELVVVRINEAGHDDGAAGVDRRTAGVQVWSDGENLLAFDQHVGLREVAEALIHRHDGPA